MSLFFSRLIPVRASVSSWVTANIDTKYRYHAHLRYITFQRTQWQVILNQKPLSSWRTWWLTDESDSRSVATITAKIHFCKVFFFLEVAVASINSSKVPDTLKSSWYWPKTGYRNSLLPSLNSSVTKRCNAHVNRIIWSDQVTYFLTLLLLSNLGFTDLCLVQFCKVCTPIILYFYYYLLLLIIIMYNIFFNRSR